MAAGTRKVALWVSYLDYLNRLNRSGRSEFQD